MRQRAELPETDSATGCKGRPVVTVRRNRQRADDPEALAARLPNELRSFDRWGYSDHGDPSGLRDYLSAATDHLGDYAHLAVQVANAAGLSAGGWYRQMLTGRGS